MPFNIPQFKTAAEDFNNGLNQTQDYLNSLLKNKREAQLMPYQLQLLKSQSGLAEAKANQSNMLAGLLNYASGGSFPQQSYNNSSPTGMPETQDNQPTGSYSSDGQAGAPSSSISTGGQPRMSRDQAANIAAAMYHLPVTTQVVNGRVIQVNPFTGVQMGQQVGPSDFEKDVNKGKAKEISEFDKDVSTSGQLINTLGSLNNIVNSDTWKSIHPFGVGNTAQVLAKENLTGTDDQKRMIGEFRNATGTVVTDLSAKLKGSFRAGEQSLFTRMKPDISDNIPVQQGKLKSAMEMAQFIQDRSRRAAKYLQDDPHLSTVDALDRANEFMQGNTFMEVQKMRLDGLGKANPKPQAKENASMPIENGQPAQITNKHVTPDNIIKTAAAYKKTPKEVLDTMVDRKIISVAEALDLQARLRGN